MKHPKNFQQILNLSKQPTTNKSVYETIVSKTWFKLRVSQDPITSKTKDVYGHAFILPQSSKAPKTIKLKL